jgi:osmotically-inducible protein OsmY
LNAAEIGVTAKDGVVRLTGIVDSYSKKLESEAAAKKVGGVKAVVEEIKIKFADLWDRSDADIAEEALTVLKLDYMIPVDKVKVKVENAKVTLYGMQVGII